jgi:hypothetical protein
MKNILTALTLILAFAFIVSAQVNPDSSCPTVDVRGGGVPRPNETSYFTVDVDKKGKELKIEYVWTVRGGKIIEGQGTQTIAVKVLEEHNLSAEIEIKGFPEGCPNTASEMMEWLAGPEAVKIGDFSNFNTPAEKALLEKLKNELPRCGTSQIYVIDKSSENISEEKMRQRARKISRLLTTRLNIEAQRITITRWNFSARDYTEIWLVPPGANIPTP